MVPEPVPVIQAWAKRAKHVMRTISFSHGMAGTVLVLVGCALASALAEQTKPAVAEVPIRVEVAIKARQFEPSSIVIPADRAVRLVFKNQDAELHAFVPIRFLDHVPLHVEGNGALQFGDKGLLRVLIPSGGEAEIQFVPRAAGIYRYRCDLPGHQMVGEIVVEELRCTGGVEG